MPHNLYRICPCLLRPELHWNIRGIETWMIFLAMRKVLTSEEMRESLSHPGDSARTRYDALRLFVILARTAWHAGGFKDDPEFIERVQGEFEKTPWRDFEDAWTTARSRFAAHPERAGILWHPRLEEIRREECEVRAEV